MSDISTGVKEMLWLWLCGKADKNMFGTIEGREAVLIAYFVINVFLSCFKLTNPVAFRWQQGKLSHIKTVLNVTYCMC